VTGKNRRSFGSTSIFDGELPLRAGTAFLLATLAGFLTYSGVWPFTLMIAAGSAILAWEWSRLVRNAPMDSVFYVHAVAVIAACISTGAGAVWLAMLALGAGTLLAAVLTQTRGARAWSAFGVVYLGLPGILLVLFRSDAAFGIAAVFFLFLVVWSADIAAYFTGRAIGGPKLAPKISPGKTWSGLAGGLAVPTLLAYGFAVWLGDTRVLAVALLGAGLAFASQIGDLAESAIKRKFQVKDSGQLLPGHGGLFDRVDGLIGAALAAGGIAVARNLSGPGEALLMWP